MPSENVVRIILVTLGFGYGLFRFFRDESALYVRMIIFGVGCAILGRLFETLGSLRSGFHVGMLGLRCNGPADTKEEEGQL